MSVLSPSEQTWWRSHPHISTWYAVAVRPRVVARRRVFQPQFSYPVASFLVSNTENMDGDLSDVEVGMTLRVWDEYMTYVKGETRVRKLPQQSSPSLAVVFTSAFGSNDIDIRNRDIIEILDEFRLWAKIPRIVAVGANVDTATQLVGANPQIAIGADPATTPIYPVVSATPPISVILYKDYDLQFVPNQTLVPVANAGAWYAGMADASGTATVRFDGSHSFAMNNGVIKSYEWDIKDGTLISGSAQTATFTARFPPGYRWVKLTVTDDVGLKHTARTLVVVCHPTFYPPLPVEFSSLQGTIEEGWTCNLSVVGVNVEDYNNCPLIVWCEESYAGRTVSFGGQAGREHVKFCGYVNSTQHEIRPFDSDHTLQALGIRALTGLLPAFSQVTDTSGNPRNWSQLLHQTLWRHLHYLIHWHSTLAEIADIMRPYYWNLYPIMRLNANEGTLRDQLDFVCNGVVARFVSDKQGVCWFEKNPQLETTEFRGAIPIALTLTQADVSENLALTVTRQNEANQVKAYAILASSTNADAVASAAPVGGVPAQGFQQEQPSNWLVMTQGELNDRTGRYYAWKNLDSKTLSVTCLNGGGVVDPAWGYIIKTDNLFPPNRASLGENDEFIVTSMDIRIDNLSGTVIEGWQLERLVKKQTLAGVTMQLPNALPEPTPFIADVGMWLNDLQLGDLGMTLDDIMPDTLPDPFVPDTLLDEIPEGAQLWWAWGSGGQAARTFNGSAVNPTWTGYGTGNIRDISVGIPYSAYFLTNQALRFLDDVSSATPSFRDMVIFDIDNSHLSSYTGSGTVNTFFIGDDVEAEQDFELTFDFTNSPSGGQTYATVRLATYQDFLEAWGAQPPQKRTAGGWDVCLGNDSNTTGRYTPFRLTDRPWLSNGLAGKHSAGNGWVSTAYIESAYDQPPSNTKTYAARAVCIEFPQDVYIKRWQIGWSMRNSPFASDSISEILGNNINLVIAHNKIGLPNSTVTRQYDSAVGTWPTNSNYGLSESGALIRSDSQAVRTRRLILFEKKEVNNIASETGGIGLNYPWRETEYRWGYLKLWLKSIPPVDQRNRVYIASNDTPNVVGTWYSLTGGGGGGADASKVWYKNRFFWAGYRCVEQQDFSTETFQIEGNTVLTNGTGKPVQGLSGIDYVGKTTRVTCIHLPHIVVNPQGGSPDNAGFEFIYGTDIPHNGTTLSYVKMNGDVVAEQIDISNRYGAQDWIVPYPKALATYYADPRVIVAFMSNTLGGATSLFYTTDMGATWNLANSSFNGRYVAFAPAFVAETGSATLTLAGASGIAYTTDFGQTLHNRTGNFGSVGNMPARGAFIYL